MQKEKNDMENYVNNEKYLINKIRLARRVFSF